MVKFGDLLAKSFEIFEIISIIVSILAILIIISILILITIIGNHSFGLLLILIICIFAIIHKVTKCDHVWDHEDTPNTCLKCGRRQMTFADGPYGSNK